MLNAPKRTYSIRDAQLRRECEKQREVRRDTHKRKPLIQNETEFHASGLLSLDDYDAMLMAQDGRCAICADPVTSEGRALAVDHCHASGRVRGLLCDPCNLGLGKFRDDPARLRAAIAYLSP